MQSQLTVVAPTCTCCARPAPLLPRDDLPGQLAVCPTSGQLYRPEGTDYVPATLPELQVQRRLALSVRIDLSLAGYA